MGRAGAEVAAVRELATFGQSSQSAQRGPGAPSTSATAGASAHGAQTPWGAHAAGVSGAGGPWGRAGGGHPARRGSSRAPWLLLLAVRSASRSSSRRQPGMPVSDRGRVQDRGGAWLRQAAIIKPVESCSLPGRAQEAMGSTLPFVASLMKTESHQRMVNRRRQKLRDVLLSRPRVVQMVPGPDGLMEGARRAQGPLAGKPSPQRGQPLPPPRRPPPLPVVKVRPTAPKRRLAKAEDDEVDSDKYSETSFLHRRKAGRVFDLSEYVTRERATFSAGRTFTWGGRMRFKLPTADKDDRDRLLRAGRGDIRGLYRLQR